MMVRENYLLHLNSAIVCHVLGPSPPYKLMCGILKEFGKVGISKIAIVSTGIMLVRFESVANRGLALASRPQML